VHCSSFVVLSNSESAAAIALLELLLGSVISLTLWLFLQGMCMIVEQQPKGFVKLLQAWRPEWC
jgi:hypothetical protein